MLEIDSRVFFIMALPMPQEMAAPKVNSKPSGCPAKCDISSIPSSTVAVSEHSTPRPARQVRGLRYSQTLASRAQTGMV